MPENQTYYSISTSFGIQKQIDCLVNGTDFDLWEIAVGDGNGNPYEPNTNQTSLKNEKWRGLITNCTQEGNKFYCTTIIPANTGGFTIREAGIFDQEGNLLLISKFPETIKQSPDTGTVKELTIRIEISFIDEGIKSLIINPNINTASTDYVDEQLNSALESLQEQLANDYPALDANGQLAPEYLPAIKTSAGYIGQIIQSLLPILDKTGVQPRTLLRLDGSTILVDGEYQAFADYLINIVKPLYPQCFCTTEEYDADIASYGQCGKFVYDEDNATIKLPIITRFLAGLSDLTQLGQTFQDQIVNITGHINIIAQTGSYNNTTGVTGAFYNDTNILDNKYAGSTGGGSMGMYFDASRVVNTGSEVQPRHTKCLTYIVVATGVDQNIEAIKDLQIPDNMPLLHPFYSDKLINNPLYLNSQGQWITKDEAPQAYNYLLEQWNSGTDANTAVDTIILNYRNVEDDFKIIGDPDMFNIADQLYCAVGNACYYQLDVTGERFKVWQKPMNDRTLVQKGVTNGINWEIYSDGYCTQNGFGTGANPVINLPISYNSTNFRFFGVPSDSNVRGTTISYIIANNYTINVYKGAPTNTGVGANAAYNFNWKTEGYTDILNINGLNDDRKYLYFKLGNTVQNAQLVNVARMEAKYSSMLMNNTLTLRVPEDFATLQEALNYSTRTTASGITIIGAGKDNDPIIIPAGQKIFIPPGNKVELQNFRFIPDASEHTAYTGIIYTENGALCLRNSRIEVIASSAVAASVRIIASYSGRIDIGECIITASSTNSNIVLASAHQEGFMCIWNSTLTRTSSSLSAIFADTGSTIQIQNNSITGSFSPALNSSGNGLSQIIGSNP